MNEPGKSRLVAGVVIVLVFLAGTAVGFFLHHAMLRRGFPGLAIGGPPPGPPPEMKGWRLARRARELDLKAGQHPRTETVPPPRGADLPARVSPRAPAP